MRRIYSHSRRSMLEKCPRQYFNDCFCATYQPQEKDPQLVLFTEVEPEHEVITADYAARIASLKELSNAYQVAGLILHSTIGEHWQDETRTAEAFLTQAKGRFDAWVSRSQHATHTEGVLLECYYRLCDAEETIGEARKRLLTALNNYFRDEGIRRFVSELQSAEELRTEQSIGGLPKVRDFTIMGRVDVCCRSGSDVRLVDWKMGGSVGDEDSLQLSLYAWWATMEFNVLPEQVILQRVFLGDSTIEAPARFSEQKLNRARARLSQDVERMADLHEYGVKGQLEAFPVCDKEKVCHQCRFQGVCPAVANATA